MIRKGAPACRRVLLPLVLLMALCLVWGVSNAATLQIKTIEVTQAIQCLDMSYGYTKCPDNSLDIVFGKPTVVRVYITHGDVACPQGDPFAPASKNVPVTISWWVLKPGQDTDGILPYQDTELFNVPCSNNITELRQSKKGSANFVIPTEKFGVPSITRGNVYRVEAEVSGNSQVLAGNVSPPRPTLNVAWALIDYHPDPASYNPPYSGPSMGNPYEAAYAFPLMRKMFPMSVSYYPLPGKIAYSGPDIRVNNGASNGREIIEAIDNWKQLLKVTPPPDVVIGWLPQGITGVLGKTIIGGEAGAKSTFCISSSFTK